MFHLRKVLRMILTHRFEGTAASLIKYIIRQHYDPEKVLFEGTWEELRKFHPLGDWMVISMGPDPDDNEHSNLMKNILITVN